MWCVCISVCACICVCVCVCVCACVCVCVRVCTYSACVYSVCVYMYIYGIVAVKRDLTHHSLFYVCIKAIEKRNSALWVRDALVFTTTIYGLRDFRVNGCLKNSVPRFLRITV